MLDLAVSIKLMCSPAATVDEMTVLHAPNSANVRRGITTYGSAIRSSMVISEKQFIMFCILLCTLCIINQHLVIEESVMKI